MVGTFEFYLILIFRAPAKIFARTVRGMLPHKRKRGILAYKRLKAYEGIPAPYNKVCTSCINSIY